ncbi:MAG: efflux RND transporter periplasmic adaptor subunit [Janthinobacterium lividum]
MNRLLIPGLALAAGVALATFVPSIPLTARSLMGLPVSGPEARPAVAAGPAAAHAHGAGEKAEAHAEEGRIAMTDELIAAAGIKVSAAGAGALVSRVAAPGVLAASQDRLARVTARVGGTLVEVRRSLGDTVVKGDVLAVIESREIAEAKGEFLAASRTAALAESTLAREARLWKQRISAEQDVLQARTTAEEVRIRVDLARQRLSALGLAEAEIAVLPRQPVASLRRLELRAPITGQITARAAVLGAATGGDTELFSLADLSMLWVEMAIPPRDVPAARQGQAVAVTGEGGARAEARLVFLSPLLDPETRSARGIAELPNPGGAWRPGAFVTAQLATAEQAVDLLVPRDAIQEVEGEKVVFVRTAEGFEKREVATGREDADRVEVVFGLDAGTEIATGNAFALRAELAKSEASHSH